MSVFTEIEKQFEIRIRDDVKEFLTSNPGYPKKGLIRIGEDQYDIRVFLSIDANSEYYIKKPLMYYLEQTKGVMIPFAIDNSSGYYCTNNNSGKVYYHSSDAETYYCITNSLEQFIALTTPVYIREGATNIL